MNNRRRSASGFSLVEMLIVVAMLTVILGAIFAQMIQAQQRSVAEDTKLELFQESREFMDQLVRDLHQAGVPNARNFAKDQLGSNDSEKRQNANVAYGLVKVGPGDLWFEGDVDGAGIVSVIRYHLETTGSNCPCLKRSQMPKVAGDALTGQTNPDYQVEVQNVLNGTANFPLDTHPIFTAYPVGETTTPVTLPVDPSTATSASTLAGINTVKVEITVRAAHPDAKTKERTVTTLVSTAKLNNCSMAASGAKFSCF
jgi:prepilin-type N-terminal cleavage/methylation domain-containing protein